MPILLSARKAKATSQRPVAMTFTEKPDMIVEIERLADELDLTKSEVIRALLRHGFIHIQTFPLLEEIEGIEEQRELGHCDAQEFERLGDRISELKSEISAIKGRWEL
jgi:hypothetical protein